MTDIVRRPVGVNCPKCAKRKRSSHGLGTGGVLYRILLSRLEECLGHEGFKCNTCGYSVKYVPRSKE